MEAVCAPPMPGYAQCLALRRTDITARPAAAMSPNTAPPGYGPADIKSAYALPGGSAGSGLTVAVVDAYDLPTAEADLAAYRSQFDLPACTTANGCFRKVNQRGVQGSYPASNAGWGQEIALDIEMVSAACPNCKILLVEADSALMANLGQSVNTAVSQGAVAVSNSYGGPESSSETTYDAAYFDHPGVAITASTGDCGWNCAQVGPSYFQNVQYPAASPYVVAVGGTRLSRDGSARGWTESAWSGAGSGCSLYESKPSWQHDVGCANRTQADVSAVADGATPVAVYYSGLWYTFGGTSVASPIIASVYALAGGPAAGTYPASSLYADAADLNDVTSGNNDIEWHSCPAGSYLCNGVAGYDGPTGLGTPNGVGAFASSWHVTLGASATNVLPNTNVTLTAQANQASESDWLVILQGATVVASCSRSVTCSASVSSAVYAARTYHAVVGNSTGGSPKATSDLITVTWTATGDTYHSITPVRAVDTRYHVGLDTSLTANVPQTFTVAGHMGIPANATGVTGNVTVVNPTYSWAVYLGPVETATPATSTINFNAGEIKANGVTVALSGTGQLSATYMSFSGNTTDLVFDITGFFTPDMSGTTYHPITPVRAVDTRYDTGLTMKLSANVPQTFQVAGALGIPGNATAVTGNVTVVNPTYSWAVYLGPVETATPATSTINFNAGDIKANGLTVALSGTGQLSATYMSFDGNTTDLVFDITGYFLLGTPGATYHPVTPVRIVDTRYGTGLPANRLAANTPETFQVTGSQGIRSDSTAVTGNLTVVLPTFSWAVYLGPVSTSTPSTSTINFNAGDILANGLTVALSGTGTLSATYMSHTGNTTDLVFDVTGYFAP